MSISKARKLIGNKIIGITCHNSIRLARIAIKIKQTIWLSGLSIPQKLK